MVRATDYEVRHCLTWARNYGEIESFEMIHQAGRKWLVKIGTADIVTVSGSELGWTEHHAVPSELLFTSREAVAFAYGLAVAGTHHGGRQAFAAREWDWDAR